MTVHKVISTPRELWLGHGTQGVTTQEVEVVRDGAAVRVTVRRLGAPAVDVVLGGAEVEALADWLLPTP